MKRDLDLVREILFFMEDDDRMLSFPGSEAYIKIDGYSEDQVHYHMQIMAQAGLLHAEAKDVTAHYSPGSARPAYVTYFSLSWQGQEFLSTLRDDKRWKEVKQIMVKAGGLVT